MYMCDDSWCIPVVAGSSNSSIGCNNLNNNHTSSSGHHTSISSSPGRRVWTWLYRWRRIICAVLLTLIATSGSYMYKIHHRWGKEDTSIYTTQIFRQSAPPAPIIIRNFTAIEQKWINDLTAVVDASEDGNILAAWRTWLGPQVTATRPEIAPLGSTNRAVVIADGRKDPSLIFLVKHTFHMLGSGWGLVFFCTTENEEWLVQQLEIKPHGSGEHIRLQLVQPLQYDQANSLPMSRIFYEMIPCETLLIIQPDGAMLRSVAAASATRDVFESMVNTYIYLGAPWSWCFAETKADWCLFGGNGGFSLRNRRAMMDLVSVINCDGWHCEWLDKYQLRRDHPEWGQRVEDVWLAHRILERRHRWPGRIPSIDVARTWAVETIDSEDPFFMHKAWLYLPQARVIQHLALVRRYYQEL